MIRNACIRSLCIYFDVNWEKCLGGLRIGRKSERRSPLSTTSKALRPPNGTNKSNPPAIWFLHTPTETLLGDQLCFATSWESSEHESMQWSVSIWLWTKWASDWPEGCSNSMHSLQKGAPLIYPFRIHHAYVNKTRMDEIFMHSL